VVGQAGQLNRRNFVLGAAIAPLIACDRSEKIAPPATALPKSGHGDLVELVKLASDIRLDIRYATANNFTGRQLYDQPRAILVRPAAEALVRAQQAAAAEGYGLTIFDAYRPWQITKKLWDATPAGPLRNYVANPKQGSKHNRGCAVDLSLHRLDTGQLVEMPSGYDEFTKRAHRDFMDASAEAIANRARLERWMESEGFRGISNEWWHFDFAGWEAFPILDIAFDAIS
jgi:zinc D-Ala-D-Ala dipeptidase